MVIDLPANGVLKFFNVIVNASQEITVDKISGLTFNPNSDWYGATNFGWRGSDGATYSNNEASVNIVLESVSVSETPFCEKHWGVCYVLPTVVSIAGVAAAIAVPVAMYKVKAGCFGSDKSNACSKEMTTLSDAT